MFCFKVPGRMFVVFWLKYTKLCIRPGEQGELIWTIKMQTVHKIVAGFAILHLGYLYIYIPKQTATNPILVTLCMISSFAASALIIVQITAWVIISQHFNFTRYLNEPGTPP